jgi:hypothetical protein
MGFKLLQANLKLEYDLLDLHLVENLIRLLRLRERHDLIRHEPRTRAVSTPNRPEEGLEEK